MHGAMSLQKRREMRCLFKLVRCYRLEIKSAMCGAACQMLNSGSPQQLAVKVSFEIKTSVKLQSLKVGLRQKAEGWGRL